MQGLKSLFAPADPWPLTFRYYSFGVRCYNTQRCSVMYNRFQFVCDKALFGSSGEPKSPGWRDRWRAGYDGGNEFAPPVEVDWISLHGDQRHARIDLAQLFKDRLVRHNVSRDEVLENWLAAKANNPVPVDILMEINDRTICVYSTALIFTKELQIPGNPNSNSRRDLILVWTHTY